MLGAGRDGTLAWVTRCWGYERPSVIVSQEDRLGRFLRGYRDALLNLQVIDLLARHPAHREPQASWPTRSHYRGWI